MAFNFNDYRTIESLCEDGYAHDKMTGKKYECDSCAEVWEKVHKKMYRNSKLNSIFCGFDMIVEENNRILALAPNNNNNSFVRYAIGGDTDFNMEFKNIYEFNLYCENNKIKEIVKNEIQTMYEHKYCYENFSLLLTTGGSGSFQLIKGYKPKNGKGVCEKFDRADNVCMFINEIDKEFYRRDRTEINNIFDRVNVGYRDKEKNKKANAVAKKIMCSYLNKFEDIYDYCKEIYKIYDRNLVDKILDFAKCEYKEDYNTGISDFIEIIKEMWECKRRFLEENK